MVPRRLAVVPIVFAWAFVGCSGGGGVGGGRLAVLTPASTATATATTTPAELQGTVAVGEPLANATVTVEDANGNAVTTTTQADGSYTLDVTGLQPPLLIQAVAPDGTVLFSITNGPGTANVTPLTNLITGILFETEGTTPATVFTSVGPGTTLPDAASIQSVSQFVVSTLAPILQADGINATTFNPISGDFVADGTGEDGLLDNLTIATATDTGVTGLEVQGANITQTAILSVTPDSTAPSLTATTTTTTPGGSTTSTTSTVFSLAPNSPINTADQAVGVLATAMAGLANQDSGNVGTLEVDLQQQCFASNFENDGNNGLLASAALAQQLSGLTDVSAQVASLSFFDGTSSPETIVGTMAFTGTLSGQPTVVDFTTVFEISGTTALAYGDQFQTPPQTRLLAIVPSSTGLTCLPNNFTNPSGISSGNLNALGLALTSLTGVTNQDVQAANGIVPAGVLYAVNGSGGTVTSVVVDVQTGAINPASTVSVVDQSSASLTGGGAAATNGTDLIVAGASNVFDVPVQGTTVSASAQSLPTTPSLTSISDNVFGPVFVAANGATTQAYQITDTPSPAPPSLLGSAASVSGQGGDSVVQDANFLPAGGTMQQLVISAGPAVGGVNVGSADVGPAPSGGFTNLNSGFVGFPPPDNQTVTPTAVAFVFNSVPGGGFTNPQLVVVGTNDPVNTLIVLPINQQTGQVGTTPTNIITMPDGQGVIGLAGSLSRNNPFSGINNPGFTAPSVVVAVTGNGPGSPEDAFGFEFTPLGNASLVFDQIGLLGNQGPFSSSGMPAILTSFAP